MTDESTTKVDQVRPQESRTKSTGTSTGDSQDTKASPSLTVGDPPRQDYGDMEDEPDTERNDSSKDKSAKASPTRFGQWNDDSADGSKGQRADAQSSDRTQGDRSSTGGQSTQQAKPGQQDRQDKSGQQGQDKSGQQGQQGQQNKSSQLSQQDKHGKSSSQPSGDNATR